MTHRADTCDRADTSSGIGTPSDGGSAYEQLAGVWGISGNKAYESGGGVARICVLQTGSPNGEMRVTMSGAFTDLGLILRAVDVNNYLLLVVRTASPQMIIYKLVASSFTLLSSYSGGVSDGDVITFSVDATHLMTGYQNGVARLSATDAAGAAGTKHGIRAHSDSVGRFDDLTFTDYALSVKIIAFIRNRRITEVPGEIEFSIEWGLSIHGEANGTVALLQDASIATDAQLAVSLRTQLAAYVSSETGRSFVAADVRGLFVG